MKSIKLMLSVVFGIVVLPFTYTDGDFNKKAHMYLEKKTPWEYILKEQYMLSTEVSNLDYREFLNALKQEGKLEKYNKYRVDSAAWLRIYLNYGKPLAEQYHLDEKYNNFPVVNITHEAAQAYCEWLTDLYNSGNHGYKHMFTKVKVRLPNQEEWLRAAKSGDSTMVYAWDGNGCRNRKGMYLANYRAFDEVIERENDSMPYKNSGALRDIDGVILLTVPVYSYFPNNLGLYNVCGNVAEMLDQPGVTIGGCYLTDKRYMRLDKIEDCAPGWNGPRPFIGFRPIMDIIEQ